MEMLEMERDMEMHGGENNEWEKKILMCLKTQNTKVVYSYRFYT